MPVVDPDAQATLIWLADGLTPSDKDFEEAQSWTLEEAVEQAYEAAKDHNKRPWILTEGHVLDGSAIAQVDVWPESNKAVSLLSTRNDRCPAFHFGLLLRGVWLGDFGRCFADRARSPTTLCR
jgi:hypothetical protein